jgi:Flp pilus assembly protein CpaB
VKKKSPPYAIIAAVVLGLVGIYIYFQIQARQNAAWDAKLKAQADDYNTRLQQLQSQNNNQPAPAPTNMRNVLYATQPVEPGVLISPAFYEAKPTPVDILPDAYTDKSDIIGQFAIRHIEKGDPLTPRNVNKSQPTLSQRILPGMRMISLPVFNADANATGGFVVDGDFVDLLFTSGPVTQVALQNVKVAYVPGPNYNSDQMDGIGPMPAPNQKIAVTFEVTPEEAQMLVNLTSGLNGSFSMILRARADHTQVKIKPFNVTDLGGAFTKLQRIADRSNDRVQELAAQIAAEQKKTQGTPNETPPPTPPSP